MSWGLGRGWGSGWLPRGNGGSAAATGFLTISRFSSSAIKWNFTKVRGAGGLGDGDRLSHSWAASRVPGPDLNGAVHGDCWLAPAPWWPRVLTQPPPQFLIDKNGCVVKRYGPMEEPLVGVCRGACLGGPWEEAPLTPFPPQVIEKDLPCYL